MKNLSHSLSKLMACPSYLKRESQKLLLCQIHCNEISRQQQNTTKHKEKKKKKNNKLRNKKISKKNLTFKR